MTKKQNTSAHDSRQTLETRSSNGRSPDPPWWRSLLSDIAKPLIIAVASSIAGVIAYVSTPLNEVVNSFVWKETADLLLISQVPELPQGQLLHVDVFVQALSPAPISDGLLTIRYPTSILRPNPETAAGLTIKTPKISSTERLTSKPLEFIADSPGTGEIVAELRTKTSTVSKSLRVTVLAPVNKIFPAHHDFSGRWIIDLGGIHGFMQIKDVARSISGEYHLNDGNGGQIEGSRDGKTFRVNLYRGAAPSRYSVEGIFDPNPKTDLEIRGRAKLLVPTGNTVNPWREDKTQDFNAVASAR